MNALWSYFWPLFATGLIVGAIAGLIAFRLPAMRPTDRLAGPEATIAASRRRRAIALAVGCAITAGAAALWHGPLGGADRFVARVEASARSTLGYYEMTQVRAHLHRDPLTRRLVLSGPADDFQRSELVRIMGDLPGVETATWSSSRGGVPLIVEAIGASMAGFLLGLLLAYLVELRRRYNAQWTW